MIIENESILRLLYFAKKKNSVRGAYLLKNNNKNSAITQVLFEHVTYVMPAPHQKFMGTSRVHTNTNFSQIIN